jgi:hypothetical protein
MRDQLALLRRSFTRTALPCERGRFAFRFDHDLAGHADQRLDVVRDFVGSVGAVAGEIRR